MIMSVNVGCKKGALQVPLVQHESDTAMSGMHMSGSSETKCSVTDPLSECQSGFVAAAGRQWQQLAGGNPSIHLLLDVATVQVPLQSTGVNCAVDQPLMPTCHKFWVEGVAIRCSSSD